MSHIDKIGSGGPTQSSKDKCDVPKLVDYKPEYIAQDAIKPLVAELEEMFTTRHRRYTWLSKHDVAYRFGGNTHAAVQILKYQNVTNLMYKLNQEYNIDLDSCLVARYYTKGQSLSWHQDNENIIDQTSPICNISIGPTRIIEFSKDNNTIMDLKMENGSILTMNPGCQSVLSHRVLPGEDESEVRYSLSFRKVNINSLPKQKMNSPLKHHQPPFPIKQFVHPSRASPNLLLSNPLVVDDDEDAGTFIGPCHLVIGDSLTKGLNSKDTVILSKGGAHPKDILDLLHSNQSILDPQNYVHMKSVTLCVGTNALNVTNNQCIPMIDILTDYDNLVSELLKLFPNAKIGLFNVLPRVCYNRDTYNRIRSFNMFITDHIASMYSRVECIMLYWEFVDYEGYLIRGLFAKDFLHLSPQGKDLMSQCITEFQVTTSIT